MSSPTEFQAMHGWMQAYVDRCDRDGWPSAEVEECAKRVLALLWMHANNDPLPKPLAQMLADETAKLAAAKAAADSKSVL